MLYPRPPATVPFVTVPHLRILGICVFNPQRSSHCRIGHPRYHVLPTLMTNEALPPTSPTSPLVEAKGGKSRLKRKQRPDGQFSHRWIRSRLRDSIEANPNSAAARNLDRALDGDIMPAMVVSLNLRGKTGRLKVGIQLFDPDNSRAFKYPWSGF